MKRLLSYICLAIIALPMGLSAQESQKESKFGVEWHGYVNYEMFYDSRQMVNAREGDVLLFPAPVKLDLDGNDINAKGSLNMLTVNSRLQAKITGPDAFGAKTSGMISGDFYGTANDNINLLRLRQAFVKLNWDKTELLFGQTWHPMFVTECFPKVLSFGAAVPFGTLSRNPQIRLTHKLGKFKVMLAALSQRDFTSTGPDEGASSIYLRNAMIPEMAGQISYSEGNLFSAVTMSYLTLQPRTVTAAGFQTDETIGGLNMNAVVKYMFPDITVNVSGLYGQNLTNS